MVGVHYEDTDRQNQVTVSVANPLPVSSSPSQPVVPTPPTPPPATIAGGGSYQSGIIVSNGFRGIAAAATLTQAGTISIQRYIDVAGTILIGAASTQALSANTAGWVAVNDGLPCASFQVTVTNSSGSTGTLSNFAILETPT